MRVAELDDDAPHLPQEVLQSMLERIPYTRGQVEALIVPIAERAEQIRQYVTDKGWVEDIDETSSTDTVAAVDGANAIDSTYAGDFVSTLAVAAEGLRPAGLTGSCRVHSTWSDFLVHDIDLDRLAKQAMTAQELALLQQLPHDFAILDGSHQTPVIVLNSALTSLSEQVQSLAIDLCERFDTAEALQGLVGNDNIVACPKADSSRDLGEYIACQWQQDHGEPLAIPASDKVLAALVLEPGTMFKAFPASKSWAGLHIRARAGTDENTRVAKMAKTLDATIEPLRDRTIRVAYVKPHGSSTAIKVEFKERLGSDFRRRVARVLSQETPAPHLQEPFCQFLADKWAKSVGLAVAAQMHGVRLDLADSKAELFLEYLIRSYRTYGG